MTGNVLDDGATPFRRESCPWRPVSYTIIHIEAAANLFRPRNTDST